MYMKYIWYDCFFNIFKINLYRYQTCILIALVKQWANKEGKVIANWFVLYKKHPQTFEMNKSSWIDAPHCRCYLQTATKKFKLRN